jgi:hypothetical protein
LTTTAPETTARFGRSRLADELGSAVAAAAAAAAADTPPLRLSSMAATALGPAGSSEAAEEEVVAGQADDQRRHAAAPAAGEGSLGDAHGGGGGAKGAGDRGGGAAYLSSPAPVSIVAMMRYLLAHRGSSHFVSGVLSPHEAQAPPMAQSLAEGAEHEAKFDPLLVRDAPWEAAESMRGRGASMSTDSGWPSPADCMHGYGCGWRSWD